MNNMQNFFFFNYIRIGKPKESFHGIPSNFNT